MNKKNRKLFLLAIITTIIVTAWSISKYKATTATSDATRTAMPVINLNESNTDLNFEINPVNNIQNYVFEVTNYSGNNESEVSMEYNIKLSNSKNLPLNYSIYKYNKETKKEEGENLLLENNITERFCMQVGSKQTDTYILKIEWKEGENSYLYSKEIDYIQISVNSRQID